MSGAAQSRVVGAYGHFHLVQDSLVIDACLDKLFGSLVHREVDRGVIVGGADDEVDVGDQPLIVAGVVVNQRAPGASTQPIPRPALGVMGTRMSVLVISGSSKSMTAVSAACTSSMRRA